MASKRQKQIEEKQKRDRMLLIGGGAVALVLVIALLVTQLLPKNDTSADASAAESAAESAASSAASEETPLITSADGLTVSHYADIEIADQGMVTVALDESLAPETVKNFVSLAESGFYNGLTFHRIINGFMMQGGDPSGDGTGGSEKTIPGEFANNGFANPISHVRGAISMARSTDMNSASSQFFIVQADSTFLDGDYAAFGFVTEGMEIVDQICADAVDTDGNGLVASDKQPVIKSVTIREA